MLLRMRIGKLLQVIKVMDENIHIRFLKKLTFTEHMNSVGYSCYTFAEFHYNVYVQLLSLELF